MKDLLFDPDQWTAIASAYDDAARRMLTPFSEEAVRWAGLGESDNVIDVAAGPGTTTLLAAREARSVQAVDFSEGMISQLRAHAADMSNVSATVADAQKLSFEDGRFSAAFSMFGLIFFPDPIAGLRELHRVLRPGGRVVISSWVPAPTSPAMKPMLAAMMDAVPPPPDQPPPEPFPFDSEEKLAAGLREAGFEDVEARRFVSTNRVASPESYWSEMRDNVFVNNMRTKAGDKWPSIEEKILAHLSGTLSGVESLDMPGLLGMGHKRA